MNITGLEANLLLFALDAYCSVDWHGKVTNDQGHDPKMLQDLRDRLFAVHEHPEEKED